MARRTRNHAGTTAVAQLSSLLRSEKYQPLEPANTRSKIERGPIRVTWEERSPEPEPILIQRDCKTSLKLLARSQPYLHLYCIGNSMAWYLF